MKNLIFAGALGMACVPLAFAQGPYDTPLARSFELATVPCMDAVRDGSAAERERICTDASKKLSSLRKWQMMSGEEEMYNLHQATVLAAISSAQSLIDNSERSKRSCDTLEKAWALASRLSVNIGAPGERYEERKAIRDTVYKNTGICREIHGKPSGAPALY